MVTYIWQNCWEGSQLSLYQFSMAYKNFDLLLDQNKCLFRWLLLWAWPWAWRSSSPKVLILEVQILFLLHAYMIWAKEWGKVAHFHYILKKWQYWAVIRSQWPKFEIWWKDIFNFHIQPQCSSKLTQQLGFAKSGQRSSFQCTPKYMVIRSQRPIYDRIVGKSQSIPISIFNYM